MMKQYVDDIKDVRELKGCGKYIHIYNSNMIDDDKKKIEEYE